MFSISKVARPSPQCVVGSNALQIPRARRRLKLLAIIQLPFRNFSGEWKFIFASNSVRFASRNFVLLLVWPDEMGRHNRWNGRHETTPTVQIVYFCLPKRTKPDKMEICAVNCSFGVLASNEKYQQSNKQIPFLRFSLQSKMHIRKYGEIEASG